MVPAEFAAFDILTTPIWVVDPRQETVLYANPAAHRCSSVESLEALRTGSHSACSRPRLSHYLAELSRQQEIVEIWTFTTDSEKYPLRCRLTLATFAGQPELLVVEGANVPHSVPVKASSTQGYKSRKQGFYQRFFMTTTAPMLLIDPARDGQIVDANLAALRFYGYTSEQICRKHTWEINALGRDVMPVMAEIARLPGGHRPLCFEHIMADGSTRFVQTYAGPIEIYGDRLMLCIIHDITEQKRLEQELEYAALRDSLTGLLNRRQFYALTEPPDLHNFRGDYSLLLVDTDNFKTINDGFGHQKGDEVLVHLARVLEQSSRPGDAIFRWGGEEFVLLLPRTSLETALEVAERIRDNVTKRSLLDLPPFTVSIGVARYQSGETVDQLFRRVDAALYQAKSGGRNRVLAA